MNQTLENRGKPNFGLFCPNLHPPPPNFFVVPLLDARHCSKLSLYQFQGTRMIQIQEKGEKPHFWPDLGPLVPNSGHQFFFFFLQNSDFVSH